jgi:peptide/nickel transport system substrate-binding protein
MEESTFQRRSWIEELHRTWRLPFATQLEERVRALSLGDRTLFYLIAGLMALGSLFALYTLERHFLITIPGYGGALTEGSVGSPQFINPLLAISDADRDLSTLTHAGLMGLSGDGSLIPVVAESYTLSDDGRRYTFVLRKNIRFSDGTPLTAEDVVFTINRAQDPALKSPEYADWSGVTATALDTRTVRLTLSKPYAPFLGITTLGILPERVWGSVPANEFAFSPLQTTPVGAGPFRVAEVTRDASGLIKRVTLEANPYYPLGRPYLDSIIMQFYSNSDELVSAVRSGAVDSAYDIPSSHALTAPYARVFGVFWNPSENQVYARPEVRKALSLAIMRDELVNSVLDGYATAIMGPVPPGSGISETPVPTPGTELEDAMRALTQAGWIYDGTARAWRNSTLKQTLDHITLRTSNVPELKNVASAVKSDWERLGIAVTTELYEPGDLSQNVIRPRKYEALLYGMVIGRDKDLYAFWDSQERNDPGLNIASYVNKEVDTLLEDARGARDHAHQLDDLQKIETAVASDYPAAFLYAPNFTYLVPPDLAGVTLPQITIPKDRFASVASWYRVTDSVWPVFVPTYH